MHVCVCDVSIYVGCIHLCGVRRGQSLLSSLVALFLLLLGKGFPLMVELMGVTGGSSPTLHFPNNHSELNYILLSFDLDSGLLTHPIGALLAETTPQSLLHF